LLHLGVALLAYQQDDDGVVPWRVDPTAKNCVSFSPNDCLDAETITRTLFVRVADSVDAAIKNNVPLASVSRHQLHYVPQTSHPGIEATGRRARGFGLIYHARLDVVGGGFEIFVPLSFIFLDNAKSYRLVIDPLTVFGLLGQPENINRVLVRADGLVGLAEGLVRDQIVGALTQVSLPAPGGVGFESFCCWDLPPSPAPLVSRANHQLCLQGLK